MSIKPVIWIIDTSVFLNILDVPGKNQDRELVLQDFEKRIVAEDTLLMPYASIVETGNHIAQLKGNYKYDYSIKFIDQVKKAVMGTLPWKTMKFPTQEDLAGWLDEFPELCGKGIGFGDFSMIKEWESQKDLFNSYSVRIWSLDDGLKGFES